MPVTQKSAAGCSGFSSMPPDPSRPSSNTGTPRWRRCSGSATGEENAGPGRVGPERVDHRADGALEDVVGQHDQDGIAAGKVLGQPERLGDATGLVLVGVRELVDAVLATVAQQAQELSGVGAAGHEHDFVDTDSTRASIAHAIIGRSKIGSRCLLVIRVSREQARPGATGQYDALHEATDVGDVRTSATSASLSVPVAVAVAAPGACLVEGQDAARHTAGVHLVDDVAERSRGRCRETSSSSISRPDL